MGLFVNKEFLIILANFILASTEIGLAILYYLTGEQAKAVCWVCYAVSTIAIMRM